MEIKKILTGAGIIATGATLNAQEVPRFASNETGGTKVENQDLKETNGAKVAEIDMNEVFKRRILEDLGGPDDVTLEHSGQDLNIPFKILRNVDFGIVGSSGAVEVKPESADTYTMTLPLISGAKLIIKGVSKKLIDDMVKGKQSTKKNLGKNFQGSKVFEKTASIDIVSYSSPKFIQSLLEKGYEVSELVGYRTVGNMNIDIWNQTEDQMANEFYDQGKHEN